MAIQISGPVVLPDGSVTAVKISSGAATVGFVLTADGVGGADFDELPAAGGGLLASGATVGATAQRQILTTGVGVGASPPAATLGVNQSGTGDIATLQDAGVTTVRVPDQGGVVLVPQAGGFQVLTGLIGYDNAAAGFKRLKFQHEDHTGPVPIDPRNGFRNAQIMTTYP